MKIITFLKKSLLGKLTFEEQREYLISKKHITPKELAAAVKFLIRKMPQKIELNGAIDICGTGGSNLDRINTSTISAFILASLGIKIAKHGNKAASGRFGSFDLLENLGINPNESIMELTKKYIKLNLAFLYARQFHPIMAHFAEVRKSIAMPTFFNLLGPLLNPANIKKRIIGTPFKEHMRLLAETCRILGGEKVIVVSGEDGLDEVTLTGKTEIVELKNGEIKEYTLSPEIFGLKKCQFSHIKGGNPKFNTKIAKDILYGEENSHHRDLVLINAALALKLIGRENNLKKAYKIVEKALKDGGPLRTFLRYKRNTILAEIIGEIKIPKVNKTIIEKSHRNFYRAINANQISVIAEIKRKSPISGHLSSREFSPSKIAEYYEKNCASAISVLCEKKHFLGHPKHMLQVSKSTLFVPILCKNFIIFEEQIYEARHFGANAILLIASILTNQQLDKFLKIANRLNMDAVCEINNEEELRRVLKAEAKIIGINNRNLETFKIDLRKTERLAKLIPREKLIISESGFRTSDDLKKIPKRINAVLIGSSLMKGQNLKEFVGDQIKICGIRNLSEAIHCESKGVNFIGLNFVNDSHRKISKIDAIEICQRVQNVKKVGIFKNHKIDEVNKLAPFLDFVQLCGDENLEFIKRCTKPVIKTIAVNSSKDLKQAEKFFKHCAFLLFDHKNPGSGQSFNHKLLKNFKKPFFVAGGINLNNLEIIKKMNPVCMDIASGAETDGNIDLKKINSLITNLKK